MEIMEIFSFLKPVLGPIIRWFSNRMQRSKDLKLSLRKNLRDLINYPSVNFDLSEEYKKFSELYSTIISYFDALSMLNEATEMENYFETFDQRMGGIRGSHAVPKMKKLAKKILDQL